MDFDVKPALNDIISKLTSKLTEIINICNEHDGEAIFCFVTTFDPDNKPALYFDKDFLDVVHKINATIQMDMYIE